LCWSGRVCFGFPIRGGCVDMPTGAGCFPLVSVHVSVWLRRVLCFCLGVAVVSVVPDWLVCSGLGLAFVGTSGKALGGYVVAAGRCGCDPGGDGYNCGGGRSAIYCLAGSSRASLIPTLLGGWPPPGLLGPGLLAHVPALSPAPPGARPGPAKPTPAHPSPTHPIPAQPGACGTARPRLVLSGAGWVGR